MRRKFFNHHKLKRRLKRRMHSGATQVLLGARDGMKSTHDFAWHEAKLNPFYHNAGGRRVLLYSILIAASFLGMILLLFFHPFFHITQIRASGFERISRDEFIETVRGSIANNILLLVPAKSYALVRPDAIADILRAKYPLAGITIQKIFPNGLEISIQEKISTIIYDNGATYSTLGLDGNILEIVRKVGENEWQKTMQTVTSTNARGEVIQEQKILEQAHIPEVTELFKEVGNYPLLYRIDGVEGDINDHVVLPVHVKNTIDWHQTLQNDMKIPVRYLTLMDEIGNAEILTAEGWHIACNLSRDPASQLFTLQTIIKDIPNRRGLRYIDVRYQGRGFWR